MYEEQFFFEKTQSKKEKTKIKQQIKKNVKHKKQWKKAIFWQFFFFYFFLFCCCKSKFQSPNIIFYSKEVLSIAKKNINPKAQQIKPAHAFKSKIFCDRCLLNKYSNSMDYLGLKFYTERKPRGFISIVIEIFACLFFYCTSWLLCVLCGLYKWQ